MGGNPFCLIALFMLIALPLPTFLILKERPVIKLVVFGLAPLREVVILYADVWLCLLISRYYILSVWFILRCKSDGARVSLILFICASSTDYNYLARQSGVKTLRFLALLGGNTLEFLTTERGGRCIYFRLLLIFIIF